LRFEDRPDYSHLRKMFKELLVKEGYEYDYAFDWVIMNEKLVNQNVLTMVDNGEDNGESKQSSMVGNNGDDPHGPEKNKDDEDKSDNEVDGKGTEEDDNGEKKDTDGTLPNDESAKKNEDEEGSLANNSSLLGGEA
jgi:hypothetical protein